jgi:hypothetical protein
MKGQIMTSTAVDIQSSKRLMELAIGGWFTRAGLELNRIIPAAHEISIVEAVPLT